VLNLWKGGLVLCTKQAELDDTVIDAPVKAAKFALRFIYFLSIHCRFQEKGVINGVIDECVRGCMCTKYKLISHELSLPPPP
jgi:hypothetical protein